MTTLHVRIESQESFDERVARKLRAVDDGEFADLDGEPVVSLPDEQALETVLNEKNLELLRTSVLEEPDSIRELARLVGRDVKNVSRAVNKLSQIGVMDLEPVGRAKRPRVPYDELEVVYTLRGPGSKSDLVA